MNYAFLRFPNFAFKAVTLSYDDDVSYNERLIGVLDKYGLKCTFNLNSGLFAEKEGERNWTVQRAYNVLKDSVHEVAIHGVKHVALEEVSLDVGTNDIIEDRKNLEKVFGTIIKGMAYANGSYNDKIVEMLKTIGIKYARTTVSTWKFDIPTDWLRLPATCRHCDPKLMELVDEFLKDNVTNRYWSNKPKLFYLWGHSYEFNDDNNWDVIENFAKKVGNRSDVWYATNGEVYDYVNAYENLEYSVDGSIIKNSSNIDVYLYYYNKEILVKAGSVVKVDA